MYLKLDSEDDEELHRGSSDSQQDFRDPLQPTEASVHFAQPSEDAMEDVSDLKGETDSNESTGPAVEAHALLARVPNRASRRKTARQFRAHTHRIVADANSKIYTMTKSLARPPGTSFLGARAIKAQAHIGSLNEAAQDVIIDSGSDITLISKACWEKLSLPPKLKAGQKINLIQITGAAKINGYVNVDLYFPTGEGYVQLEVEAYVVKGMSTPFILGNDFQDQYMLSILREEGNTEVLFGESGKRIAIENSTSPSLMDWTKGATPLTFLSRQNRKHLNRGNSLSHESATQQFAPQSCRSSSLIPQSWYRYQRISPRDAPRYWSKNIS